MRKNRRTYVIAVSALMLALATVLGFLRVPVTDVIEIRFGFLPIACTGMLFGPVVGAEVGALSDILAYFVKPTGPFFPGFTISSALTGMIYGFLFYRHEITWRRLAAAQLIHAAVISLLLNSAWLTMLYGKGFLALLSVRFVKTAVMFPVEVALLWFVLKPAQKASGEFFPAAPGKKRYADH